MTGIIMKQTVKHLVFLSTVVVAMVFGRSVFADSAIDALVQGFNAMNGDTGSYTDGYAFVFYNYSGINTGAESLNQYEGMLLNAGQTSGDMFDAYNADATIATTNGAYFSSICIEPQETVYTGKLNYGQLSLQDDYTTKTLDTGNVVTLGAAYLFKLYATGELASVSRFADFYSLDRDTNVGLLREAIQALMNVDGSTATADNNPYLAYLAESNNIETYWTQTYYLNGQYVEMGDYVVFAMNVYNGEAFTVGGQPVVAGDVAQDLLYIARLERPSPPDTPEPGTVLLWSLGGLGLAAASRIRKRRMKKAV